MEIIEFSKENIEKYKNCKVLIVADYGCIGFKNDCKTIQYKLSEKYNLDFYPVIFMTPMVEILLFKYYGNYDYWVIEKSLINEFKKKDLQLSQAN